jgi:hypothetical protein
MSKEEVRDSVQLTNLDQRLLDGAWLLWSTSYAVRSSHPPAEETLGPARSPGRRC